MLNVMMICSGRKYGLNVSKCFTWCVWFIKCDKRELMFDVSPNIIILPSKVCLRRVMAGAFECSTTLEAASEGGGEVELLRL